MGTVFYKQNKNQVNINSFIYINLQKGWKVHDLYFQGFYHFQPLLDIISFNYDNCSFKNKPKIVNILSYRSDISEDVPKSHLKV